MGSDREMSGTETHDVKPAVSKKLNWKKEMHDLARIIQDGEAVFAKLFTLVLSMTAKNKKRKRRKPGGFQPKRPTIKESLNELYQNLYIAIKTMKPRGNSIWAAGRDIRSAHALD